MMGEDLLQLVKTGMCLFTTHPHLKCCINPWNMVRRCHMSAGAPTTPSCSRAPWTRRLEFGVLRYSYHVMHLLRRSTYRKTFCPCLLDRSVSPYNGLSQARDGSSLGTGRKIIRYGFCRLLFTSLPLEYPRSGYLHMASRSRNPSCRDYSRW